MIRKPLAVQRLVELLPQGLELVERRLERALHLPLRALGGSAELVNGRIELALGLLERVPRLARQLVAGPADRLARQLGSLRRLVQGLLTDVPSCLFRVVDRIDGARRRPLDRGGDRVVRPVRAAAGEEQGDGHRPEQRPHARRGYRSPVADPLSHRDDLGSALSAVVEWAHEELAALDERAVRSPVADQVVASLDRPLPERGDGTLAALRELLALEEGAVRGAGPRFFHFVQGGVTPAALGADWLATLLDQNAFSWVNSPLASQLERVSLRWLRELLDLPSSWDGVLTTGATMANFTALGAARRWWAGKHGRDVEIEGLAGLPSVPVLSSGYIHPSAVKALRMLGIGSGSLETFARDDAGRIDLDGLEAALVRLGGSPAIVVANAGEVNAGDFDPIEAIADLAERHDAWLHVDGAFGLFARVSPRSAELAAGVERAQSAIADGHKWLNVPYDCGIAFVSDPALLPAAFAAPAAYLPPVDPERPTYGYLGPEMSRRARSFAVWATLAAYGRDGYRAMVERHLDLAAGLRRLVDAAPDLELLAPVKLCVVCFRYRPPGIPESDLDTLNARLGEAVLADGRVFVGTTRYEGRTAFRPTIVNWRSTERDVQLLVEVIRELGAGLR
jgi:glutamate/tyrosine decarboxylase-like PLP-dependent enzyme